MRAFPVLALPSFGWPDRLCRQRHGAGAYGTGSGLEPIVRTVYVTVTDGQGAAVPDLTAGGFHDQGRRQGARDPQGACPRPRACDSR